MNLKIHGAKCSQKYRHTGRRRDRDKRTIQRETGENIPGLATFQGHVQVYQGGRAGEIILEHSLSNGVTWRAGGPTSRRAAGSACVGFVGGGAVAARICISDKIPGDADMLVPILRILKMCWDHTLRITILKSHALCLVLLKRSKQVGREQGCC